MLNFRPQLLRPTLLCRVGFALGSLLACATAVPGEIAPRAIEKPLGNAGEQIGRYSERTLVLAIEIDHRRSRLGRYAVKPRPYRRILRDEPVRTYEKDGPLQIEVVLHGDDGEQLTRRIDVAGLCLSHGPLEPPHIAGDTIRLHRESFLVELPEIATLDRIEVAYYEEDRGIPVRRSLGVERLDRARFDPAGTSTRYADLAIADGPGAAGGAPPAASTPIWPEDVGDPDIYRVYGDESEGDRRINVVIVPDGYTYAQKEVMETHAQALVDYFRSKRPYAEHDPFMNYILVYAYSQETGTDQCDCGIIRDTAMGTRFPESVPTCGSSTNRCLYYGGGCDTSGTTNIAAAELRAPFQDETVVMVDTSRYGGCGGSRAVYAAGNGSALEIAVHEVGHTLGGLADEYQSNPSCGSSAGEINTSLNAVDGNWPEWIAELGAPRQGAQYFDQCIYRPTSSCEMRSLGPAFCAVCNQRWSLVTFGHPNVSATAPLESATPSTPQQAAVVGGSIPFSITTRLSSGAAITNEIRWSLTTPGLPVPTLVAQDTASHVQVFNEEGTHTLTAEVIADTNFVKPAKYGANRDVFTWEIEVTAAFPPSEVSAPGSDPLRFLTATHLEWQDAAALGASAYNLYRGELSELGRGGYGTCLLPNIAQNFSFVLGVPAEGAAWCYLVTARNSAGEGSLGQDSAGGARNNSAPCK